jgi:hypothetical protein
MWPLCAAVCSSVVPLCEAWRSSKSAVSMAERRSVRGGAPRLRCCALVRAKLRQKPHALDMASFRGDEQRCGATLRSRRTQHWRERGTRHTAGVCNAPRRHGEAHLRARVLGSAKLHQQLQALEAALLRRKEQRCGAILRPAQRAPRASAQPCRHVRCSSGHREHSH